MTTFNNENTSLSESEADINLVTLKISVVNLSEVMKPAINDEETYKCNHWTDRGGWAKRVLKGICGDPWEIPMSGISRLKKYQMG